MADPFKIIFKILLHGYRNPVYQVFLFFGQQFWRQRSQTLFRIGAVGGTAKIYARIENFMTALLAFTGAVVFEKFHLPPAFGASAFKNSTPVPISAVLSRALHMFALLRVRLGA
jgi:hypothetical protein